MTMSKAVAERRVKVDTISALTKGLAGITPSTPVGLHHTLSRPYFYVIARFERR
jgi:hypothetical protein